MGSFKGVQDARVGGGGVYFLQGVYQVKIKKVWMQTSRKREDFFMIDAQIIESNNDKRTAGMTCTQMIKMSLDAALGNVKGFVAAAMGIDPDEVDEEMCEACVEDDNPVADTIMNLEVVDIKTREGGDFSLHKWEAA